MDDFSQVSQYTKAIKYGSYAVGIRFTIVGVIFFAMIVITLFNYSSDVNETFTFNRLLSIVRDVPQLSLEKFQVSRYWAGVSDSAFDFGISAIQKFVSYRLPDKLGLIDISGVSNYVNGIVVNVSTPIINSLGDFKLLVNRFVATIFTPLDFVGYLVGSFAQLLIFISYLLNKFFFISIM